MQTPLFVGVSKVMLSGMITDDRVLNNLVLMYISPETASKQEVRQCLAYFFPVYYYSSAVYQRRMQKIFVSLYEDVITTSRDWDDEQEPVSPAQVALMFVDWTDPQKVVNVGDPSREHTGANAIHVDMASDIVKALFNENMTKDDKKTLCQLLGKLYIPYS